LVALFSLRESLRQTGAVVAGSLLAGAILYQVSSYDHAAAKAAIQRVPFVREWMFTSTQHDLEALGIWAMCKGPVSGIPYKVYAVQAPNISPLNRFLLVSIPARLERLLLSWALFATIGVLFRKKLQNHTLAAAAGHALYWVAVYVYYWSTV
jgi:hypothetical protein